MKLMSLKLRNFKGIKEFAFEPNGKSVSVFGDNATGKTSLFDAFLWLLFDKDSSNKKDFSLKTLDAEGKEINNLEHEVEAVLSINDEFISLRKVYTEKWTRKKGNPTATFTGHTTDYFIDDVPVKKKEYETRIADICSEDIFKLLTNPAYFNEQLHWQERRKILLEVCGDVEDEEVIKSDDKLKKLPSLLGNHGLEDFRKIIASKKSAINKELEKIPVRIDEITRSLPDIKELKQAEGAEALLKAEIKQKEEELVRLLNGGEVAEKQKQVSVIETELLKIEIEYSKKHNDKINAKRVELRKATDKLDEEVRALKGLKANKEAAERKIETLEKEVVILREKFLTKNDEQFAFEQSNTCPTCNQALPKEQLQEAREKALAEYNKQKAIYLEDIRADGKGANEEIALLKKAINEDSIQEKEREVVRYRRAETDLINELKELEKLIIGVQEYPEYVEKLTQKSALEKAIETINQNNIKVVATVKERLELLNKELERVLLINTQLDQYEKGRLRINELEEEEKNLAKEYEELEQAQFLTEEFIRAKVSLLEEKINSKFNLARFKLFDVQVNGGINEVCETLYNGVPYSSGLNNGARINVGLDIINTLAEHYNFKAPIFADNAEAVTQLIETKGQLIRLVVSEADKALRVVKDNR
jgi:DNA repair exonuclease SbcCD ATPase subunit